MARGCFFNISQAPQLQGQIYLVNLEAKEALYTANWLILCLPETEKSMELRSMIWDSLLGLPNFYLLKGLLLSQTLGLVRRLM